VKWLALWVLRTYQRHFSSDRGWRCAHACLHGTPGCASFAERAYRRHGFFLGYRLMCRRFQKCSRAAAVLAGRTGGHWKSHAAGLFCTPCLFLRQHFGSGLVDRKESFHG
jgi:putative component of membrane protein insertase Oxa1/YidC/SpoIIIJ protein YidD